MENPSSAEKARERAEASVRGQIERIVKMAKSMRMDPDLTPVWDGDEFRGLPADVQREFVAWAQKEGYAIPDSAIEAPEAKPDAEPDPRLLGVRGQIERIAKMAKSMRMDPDLTPVWDGDEFRGLPAELQSSVREWAAGQGYPVEDAAAEPEAAPAPEPETEEPAASEPEQPERKEKRENEPKRRQFMRYRVERRDDGGFALHEDYQEWDRRAEAYRDKSVETSIAFTGALAEKMEADPEVMATVAGFSAQVREELDRSTVKIYFDRPKNEPEKVFPKWKYALEGKTVEEPIKPADIPADIMALVKGDKQYFKTDAWKKWFGRQMQKKREDVIAAELAKLFPDAAPAPEARKAETAAPAPEARQDAAEPEVPETAVVTPELAAGISMLVDKFSPLFELPRQASELIDYVTTFSKGIFEYQLMQKGKASKKPTLPPELLKSAVRDALLAKFADEPATAAEIRRLTAAQPPKPPREAEAFSEPPAPPKEDDDDVIEVQDEWIEQSLESERRDDPVDAAYVALRDDLDKMPPAETLDGYVAKLKEIKKAGLDNMSAAADRLLNDIDFGKAGEISENRTEGAARTEAEEQFFAEHPLLDKRNVQRLPDGRVIVHVDRLHPEDTLRRAFGRTVQDAMERRDIADDPAMMAKIAEYLLRIVTGKNENKVLIERFTKDLAAFDARAEEMTIKNIDKLGAVVANLVKEIESKRR